MTIEIWALAFMAVVAGVFAALYWHATAKKKEVELAIRFDHMEQQIWDQGRSIREELKDIERHVGTMEERCSRNANNCSIKSR